MTAPNRDPAIRDRLIIDGFIREFCHNVRIDIPKDIIQICFKWYHIAWEILTFSHQYNSNKPDKIHAFIFSDNDTCVKRNDDLQWSHKYILADCNSVFNGIHCWRVNVKNPHHDWISFQVSQKKEYNDHSYNKKGVYGISTFQEKYIPELVGTGIGMSWI